MKNYLWKVTVNQVVGLPFFVVTPTMDIKLAAERAKHVIDSQPAKYKNSPNIQEISFQKEVYL